MTDFVIRGEELKDIADALREVTGTVELTTVEEMPAKIRKAHEDSTAAGYAAGEQAGREAGYEEGFEAGKAQGGGEEILFSNHGTMYKRNMVIEASFSDGFHQYAYRYCDQMETLSAPNAKSLWTAVSMVFQGCTALKTASLPKIQRIGNAYFGGCTALEDLTLGCEEVPMESIGVTACQNCSALVRFNYIGVIQSNFNIGQSPLLDDVSCENIANSLADLTGKTAQTLTVHGTVGAKMVAMGLDVIIRDKNWTLVIQEV